MSSERSSVGRPLLRGKIDRLRSEQRDQAGSTDTDLDAIGSDIDAAKQCHQHNADLVWRKGSEFFCDLTATTDQPVLSSRINDIHSRISIEDRSLIGKKDAKSGDHQGLKIGRRDAPSV